jgi:outer membrane protein TolC
LGRSRSLSEAERERVPQAGALPDPTLSLGLQNDGFKRLEIGRMETSYTQIMVTQSLPWPGKRGLRTEIAQLGFEASRSATERTRLDMVANVKRAYLELRLVRAQRDLLDQQALFQKQALDLVRTRYEVGQGTQADLLRAQLEQNRLRQKRLALDLERRTRLAALQRLLHRTEPLVLEVPPLLETLPERIPANDWKTRAEQESPELQASRLGTRQAERSLDLAKRDRLPDFAVSAGVMPRGSLDPMWQVGVSISLPLWSRQKQQKAVAEQELRRRAQGQESEALRALLAQRIAERELQLDALFENLQLFRDGLLVQSQASFQASLAQYEAGRGSFLSVLEGLNGWIADRSAYLQTLAQAQAILLSHEAFSLETAPTPSTTVLGTTSLGMGGSPSTSPGRTKSAAPETAPAPSSNSSMSAM